MADTIAVRLVGKDDLDTCLKIRIEVFVEEQNVPLDLEIDGLDDTALHFLVTRNEEPVGTARVILKDNGRMAKIGRVAILKTARGLGLGQILIREIEKAQSLQSVSHFSLESQTHAIGFYGKLGYVAEGPEFMDAGIPHRLMTKRNPLTQP